MLNLIPISAITSGGLSTVESISCPICHSGFVTEREKSQHLDAQHPGWALTLMFGFLRQVPRENG